MDLRVRLICNCSVRRFLDLYELIELASRDIFPVITNEEWEIIWRDDLDLYKENK